MIRHFEVMVRDNDKRVKRALRVQNVDKKSVFYGGVPQSDSIFQAKSTIYTTADLMAAFLNKDSEYCGSDVVLERIDMALGYIERCQHDNGLFDYVTCNFFSAPDTAFCLWKLIPTLELCRKIKEGDAGEFVDPAAAARIVRVADAAGGAAPSTGKAASAAGGSVADRIENIVHAGAKGLLLGGFHTPNHRWAIASALAYCGRLFGDDSLTRGADIYLREGIDCNGDGEYSEKSAGNYNGVNNDAMILLSEAFGDDSYDENAVRNLRMMLTYWEPDESVFTANSTRFDKDRLVYPKEYYLEYLKMGIKYDIPEFLDMANYIFEIIREKGIPAPDFVTELMVHPEWVRFEHEGAGYARDYEAFYEESGIARIRRGDVSCTIMNGKSNFLYVHNKSIKVEMKVAGSFCEHRAFKSETMERSDDGTYVLRQTMKGWYYLPFEEKPETSDWWKMDNASRKKKLGPDMRIEVVVREADGGVDVEVVTAGVEGAPWRIELAFSGIDRISNAHMSIPVHGDEVIVLRDSYFEASNAEDVITVGPAFGLHEFTEGKEDSELKNPGAATVYFTDYTPFRHVISIRG